MLFSEYPPSLVISSQVLLNPLNIIEKCLFLSIPPHWQFVFAMNGQLYGLIDGRLDGLMDDQMEGQIDVQMDGQVHGHIDGHIDVQMNSQMDGQMDLLKGWEGIWSYSVTRT